MPKIGVIIAIVGIFILGGIGFRYLRYFEEPELPVVPKEHVAVPSVLPPAAPSVGLPPAPAENFFPPAPEPAQVPGPEIKPPPAPLPQTRPSPAPQAKIEPKPSPPSAAPEPPSPPREPEEFIVRIYSNVRVEPANLTIRSGDTVTFINEDKNLHWPGADPHPTHSSLPAFDALGGISRGQSYSYTFRELGAYGYHEHLMDDPSTWGIITVLP